MSQEELPKGDLGGILGRFGTLLEGQIVGFPKEFQLFLKNEVFETIWVLELSWRSTWGILGR